MTVTYDPTDAVNDSASGARNFVRLSLAETRDSSRLSDEEIDAIVSMWTDDEGTINRQGAVLAAARVCAAKVKDRVDFVGGANVVRNPLFQQAIDIVELYESEYTVAAMPSGVARDKSIIDTRRADKTKTPSEDQYPYGGSAFVGISDG